MFQKGQEVICINDKFPAGIPTGGLSKGSKYTIREAFVVLSADVVYLQEINRKPEGVWEEEIPFAASRFAPIEKKTEEDDVAMIKKISGGVPAEKIKLDKPVKAPKKVTEET